jgi:hypothetical protein
VAKQSSKILRKRRTREHVIADLSTNFVERHALLCGFSVERIRLDYGIDLIVHTYNRKGEIENGRILFQLKATDRIKVSATGSSVFCRLEKADLLYWLGESMPVVVVQYDAKKDIAYWLHIQEHLDAVALDLTSAAKEVTLSMPRANLLDKEAMERLARQKNDIVVALKRGSHRAN